jgi:hypothetical protein
MDVASISDDAAAANNLESACDNYSVTRGLAGTALPAVAADGAGGLPISDAGGLDLDAILTDTGTTLPATLATIAAYIDTEVAAIKAVTDALPDAGALTAIAADTARLTAARAGGLTDLLEGGRLDLILDIIAADVVNIDGVLPATLAVVNAQVADVLKTDTIAEMAQQAPPVNPTFEQAVMYIFMMLRNANTSSATKRELKNDAGTVIAKGTMSVGGGVFTQGKLGTGP